MCQEFALFLFGLELSLETHDLVEEIDMLHIHEVATLPTTDFWCLARC